jgi:hypothetical protein
MHNLNFNCRKLPAGVEHDLYLLDFNRKINERHVNVMMNSIEQIGIVRSVVVADLSFLEGVKRKYIVDGQHLYYGIVRQNDNPKFVKTHGTLDIPITLVYPKNKGELISIMAKLNTTANSWILSDYIHAWAAISNVNDYLRLKQLQRDFNYTYSTLCTVMNPISPGHAIDRMKKGTYKIQEEKLGLQILDNLKQAFDVFPRGMHAEQRVFVESYISFFQEHRKAYNHVKFIDAISKNSVILTRSLHSVPECSTVLKELYHGRIKEASRIILESTRGSQKRSLIITNETSAGKQQTRFLSTR